VTRYAYLSVAPRPCDVVAFPDGTQTVVRRGLGNATADGWSASAMPHEPPDALRARAQRRAAHDEWQRKLDQALDASLSVMHSRMIRESFLAENPEPFVEGGEAPDIPRVSESQWWCARLDDFDAWLDDAGAPFPWDELAQALNTLAARGWAVRHVSEERRALHESETVSRTELTGARLLLEREA
jgi:hypothetical protein